MSKRGAQRTAGRSKPTNSAKAQSAPTALLTHQHTNGLTTFAIFSGETSYGIGGGGGSNETSADHDLDPELRVILRKLTKKDSTTKIRAFDELRDYCDANESDESIRAILPFFVRQYRKWSIDQDQRVRDECQSTFDTIGMRMKKNMLPYLKTILPSWLMAQCDSYAPAASKAKFLYSKLFNGEAKQAEVVYFARNEIMSALTDEINECSDVLKDKKANEMETDDAHERRLTQVLLALALFLNYCEPNKRVELTDKFKLILDSGKFWKLDKIKSKQIQISFYRCLYTFINLIPDVMHEYIGKIVPLVFYALNEAEPKLCPLVWDCLILCLDTFDECWSLVNYQKAFLPKLWAFLRHACHGNVFGVKDCLLALMSKVPATIIEDRENYHFIENFFQAMEEGILSLKGRQQTNNINSLLKAYMDCLLYILEHHSPNPLAFLNERMLPLIRLLLIDKECSIRNVYPRQYIYLLSSLKSFRLYSEHLNDVRKFFQNLIDQNESSIDLKYVFEQAIVLFKTILDPPKLKNLRFASTTHSSTDLSSIDSTTTFQIDNDDEEIDGNSQNKDAYLVQLAVELCRFCFQFCIQSNHHPAFEQSLDLFTCLLNCSTSNNMEMISKLIIAENNNNNNDSSIPELFYLNYAKPLLKMSIQQRCSLESIVQLTIKTLNIFDSSELVVERVLADLIQLESSRRFYFLLASIVCRYESSPAFHSWLQEHGVLEELLNMTASVVKSSQTSDLSLPVSAEEFQLLSSLLCSDKPTQFLTQLQQEQVVYLACRLFEQQTRSSISESVNRICVSSPMSSSTDGNSNDDLMKSIDCVARHLFERIDSTFVNRCTQDLFKLYFDSDLNNVIMKNTDVSLHRRRLWFLAVEQAQSLRDVLLDHIAQYSLAYVNTQLDNDLFIDTILSLCTDVDNLQSSSSSSLSNIFHSSLLERISLSDDLICESWIYGTLHGWLLPHKTITLKVANDVENKSRVNNQQQRLIDVQFVCLFLIRQYELSCHLWSSNLSQQLIRKLVSNFYFFQHRRIDIKHLRLLLERLFNSISFQPEFQLIDCLSSIQNNDLYTEILYYHTYCIMKDKYLQINERDDDLHFTMTLDNNDEINAHLILCSRFRESQLKLLIPYLTEQCSDLRRSPLTLAALSQCLTRANHSGLILEDNQLRHILDVLIRSTSSSIETSELIQLWNALLNHGTFVYSFEQQHWDNVLCLISNLFQGLTDVTQQGTLRTEFLFIHGSNLLTTIGKYLTNEQDIGGLFSKQLLEEWAQFYSKEIYQRLLPLYVALPSALAEFSPFYVTHEMIKSICSAMCTIPTVHLLSNHLRPLFHAEDIQLTLSESLQTVFNHLYRLLSSTPNRSIQYSSYLLLTKLLPHISQTLIITDNNEDIAEDNKICRLPGSMIEALQRTEDTIGQLLADNDIVEEHLLDDDDQQKLISHSSAPTAVTTDKEHIIVAELLNYKLLLNLIGCFSTVEQRYTYTLMLQEKKLVDRLLSIVLGLIPANPVYIDPISMEISSITKKLSHTKSMFEHEIQLNPSGELNLPYTIPHLACSVYLQCLSSIPALVREWYRNQPKRIRDAVDRVTQKFASPTLIQRELDSVSSIKSTSTSDTGAVTVKKHSNTREITAIYNIETSRVEICIRLPINYPLAVASVECTHHVGFTNEQWNKWMLQLKTNLVQQNGAIADGLLHWKRNIDKMMQGIEECSICYCILHTNNELPKRTCRTCKKKFHDACLFRWFRSSNKSTCPHCRANF